MTMNTESTLLDVGDDIWLASNVPGQYQGKLVITPCYCCESDGCMGHELFWAPPGALPLCLDCYPQSERERQ